MVGGTLDWKEELGRFLKPFLDRLGHKARRQMCPLYVSGPSWRSQEHSADGGAACAWRIRSIDHFIAAGVLDARRRQNCLFKRCLISAAHGVQTNSNYCDLGTGKLLEMRLRCNVPRLQLLVDVLNSKRMHVEG
jgi:hypothetical protein